MIGVSGLQTVPSKEFRKMIVVLGFTLSRLPICSVFDIGTVLKQCGSGGYFRTKFPLWAILVADKYPYESSLHLPRTHPREVLLHLIRPTTLYSGEMSI